MLPNTGRPKVTSALANPADYIELAFEAVADTPYRLWIRGRAEGNSPGNDSIHVQFTDSVSTSGAAWARIGTTSSLEVNLEDCSGCGNSGWGWEDNGWGGEDVLGPEIRFATDRATDLVRRILLFARGEEPQLRTVRLPQLVDDAVRLVRAGIPPSIVVEPLGAHDCEAIAADPTQVQQVVINLITNAAHAIGARGGTIVVSCGNVTLDELATVVANRDTTRLAKVPGVGKKTAERLVLELKDRLVVSASAVPMAVARKPSGQAAVLHEALVRMGFRPSEADRAIASLPDTERPLGDLVREALAVLAP